VLSIAELEIEAAAFLDSHLVKKPTEQIEWGTGPDDVSLFWEVDAETERAHVDDARRWQRTKFDAGFGWLHGPTEYGGRGLTLDHHRAFDALESHYQLPGHSPFGIGLGMVAPTILVHGTAALRERYLRALWRADVIACQLFSEPTAGSDLAGVAMRAVRDGDTWVLSGQKVWTSNAQYSDIGEVIARTNPDAPRHRGLSAFVVDMHAPGVEVRPLRQMTGGATFNEVFFDDVRVPSENLLGEVDQGWSVALTTLMNERASIGSGGPIDVVSFERLRQMAQHFDAASDPVLRDELMRVYVGLEVAAIAGQRAAASARSGHTPGPEMSMHKLALTQNLTAIAEWAAKVLGPRLLADGGEWGTFAWSDYVCGTPGMRIAGGSDEVLRNILGERVLGLPK